MDICIVVVNYNGIDDTLKCLRSLKAVRSEGVSVVLVDNASSDDPTTIIAKQFPWCPVIRNPVNGGWAGGNNTGIRHALERGAEHVLLLNNDTTVAPELADNLLSAATAHPDVAVLGPVIYYMDDPEQIMTDGCEFNRPGYSGFFQRKPVPLSSDGRPAVVDVDIVNGCAMMIRANVFRRIGLIDERFFLIHEESDFCVRARRAGFRCGILSEVLVWHKGSSSFKRTGKQIQRYYDARNLYLLIRKHASAPGPMRGPWSSRLAYLKYVYYRYSIERENGQLEAADAVLRGLVDGLAGRFGPASCGPWPGLRLLRRLFEVVRRWRSTTRR